MIYYFSFFFRFTIFVSPNIKSLTHLVLCQAMPGSTVVMKPCPCPQVLEFSGHGTDPDKRGPRGQGWDGGA